MKNFRGDFVSFSRLRNCAFVDFSTEAAAMQAQSQLNRFFSHNILFFLIS